jgi:hypothetical protein
MLERGAGRAARIGRRWGAACVLAAAVAGYAAPAAAGPTYYVDAEAGDDARTAEQAQAPGTPWRSIKRAVDAGGLRGVNKKGKPLAGYTVVVGPGLYAESVESKRDGLAEDPVVFRAATAGAAIIRPPGATACSSAITITSSRGSSSAAARRGSSSARTTGATAR